jgi:Protein of unknown function (DUF952)
MVALLHITERGDWEAARQSGTYRISTREVSLGQQGFIHCSLPHQLRAVAEAACADADVRDGSDSRRPRRSRAPDPARELTWPA